MKRVLVIGDAIADVYRDCRYSKKCPDAPSIDAVAQESIEVRPGGAANVALNLTALAPDVVVDLVSIIDNDIATQIKTFAAGRVMLQHAVRGTMLRKERVIVDGGLRLRIDTKSRFEGPEQFKVTLGLIAYLREVSRPDLIVLSEYSGGTLDDDAIRIIMGHSDRVMIDTKRTDLSPFSGSLLAKLNSSEYRSVLLTEPAPERHFQHLIITSGRNGSTLLSRRSISETSSVTHTLGCKAHEAHEVDVCGCGDTFMAGLAAALVSHADPFSAMQFASAAASTVVSKPRTAVADRKRTLELLGRAEV